jgi:hypothetical protein
MNELKTTARLEANLVAWSSVPDAQWPSSKPTTNQNSDTYEG